MRLDRVSDKKPWVKKDPEELTAERKGTQKRVRQKVCETRSKDER